MKVSTSIILAGVFLIIIGVMWRLGLKIGHLPGDIIVNRGAFTLYFPVTTCIIFSILLTLVFLLVRYIAFE